jgi:NitT/TauT family transport system substrate-binding protein
MILSPPLRRVAYLLTIFSAILTAGQAQAAESPLSVGVLKFGTVNWQLAALKEQGLDKAEKVDLSILELASKNATSIALQAGKVDIIVTDWVWAMRQRAAGERLLFVPYSTALGSIMVAAKNDAKTITDLRSQRIGVAGGPLDKSWLILRAWSIKYADFDIAETADVVFAAPPLLAEQLRAGQLDAVVIYWPYAARLEADGFRTLTSVSQVLQDLGMTGPMPLVGYVFYDRLVKERKEALQGFFRAIVETNDALGSSNALWDKLRPLMQAKTPKEFRALVTGFQSGIPGPQLSVPIADAEKLFKILRELGGDDLLGQATRFDPDVFWVSDKY